jgi:hypothetical protein
MTQVCRGQNLYVSAGAAAGWPARHPGGRLVPVEVA